MITPGRSSSTISPSSIPKPGFDSHSLHKLSKQFPVTGESLIDNFFAEVEPSVSNRIAKHLPSTCNLIGTVLTPDFDTNQNSSKFKLEEYLNSGMEQQESPLFQKAQKRARLDSHASFASFEGNAVMQSRMNFSGFNTMGGLDIDKMINNNVNLNSVKNTSTIPVSVIEPPRPFSTFPITPNELETTEYPSFQNEYVMNSQYDNYSTEKIGMADCLQPGPSNEISTSNNSTGFFLTEPKTQNEITGHSRNKSGDSYLSIQPEQTVSPNYENDEDRPRIQPQKFENDLYTPKWVRFSGAKKEGLCELCEPGKWLQLKNSAYWYNLIMNRYHKQYSHGISSVTGSKFQDPSQLQIVWICPEEESSNPRDIALYLTVEGYCNYCENWKPLFKNKKRFPHSFGTIDEISTALLDPKPNQVMQSPPHLITRHPLKIVAAKDINGNPFIPAGISVSQPVLKDVISCQNGQMGSLWYKHAHKCHPQQQKDAEL